MTVFRFLADPLFRLLRVPAPALAGLILSACATVPTPEAPPNNPVSAAPLPLESSVISIPLSIDLRELSEEMRQQLPSPVLAGRHQRTLPVRFNAMHTSVSMEPGSCSVTALNCLTRNSVRTVAADYVSPTEAEVLQEMHVRGVDVTLEGRQYAMTAQVEFQVDTRFSSTVAPLGEASCGGSGEDRPRFEIMLGGYLDWDEQGEVVTSPRPYYVRWLQPCVITAYQVNVESLLNLPALRDRLQQALERNVFSRLRQASLHGHLEQIWPELNAPRELRPGVWLLPHPHKVSFAELVGKGRSVSTGILVHAYPEVVRGSRPLVEVPPLPTPGREANGNEGMHMAIRGDMPLARAQELLSRQLAGLRLQVGGEPVRVRATRLFGSADKAVLALTLEQPMLAELYLTGRPVYDLERNEVRFEGLEYTPATRLYLSRAADWLQRESFLAALQSQAVFRFDETLAAALHGVQDLRVAAGQDMTLRGGIQRMRPQSLHFTRDSLVVYVLVEGRLALERRQP